MAEDSAAGRLILRAGERHEAFERPARAGPLPRRDAPVDTDRIATSNFWHNDIGSRFREDARLRTSVHTASNGTITAVIDGGSPRSAPGLPARGPEAARHFDHGFHPDPVAVVVDGNRCSHAQA
jgi:hypothetical protein